MPTYKKSKSLADAFEKAYPETLPARLAWWQKSLGIDRRRLLRTFGLSTEQAKADQGKTWAALLKDPEQAERGRLLEAKLYELLIRFDYDWKALAEYLHCPGQSNGAAGPLQDSPEVGGGGLPIDELADQSPQSFAAVLSGLVSRRGPRGKADSRP